MQADRAIEIWREGKDPLVLIADRLRVSVERGEIGLPDRTKAEGTECGTICPNPVLPQPRGDE